MKKAIFITLGVISFICGSVALAHVGGLTGYSIYNDLSVNIRYFVGFNFIVLSFLLFLASKDWRSYEIGIALDINRDYEVDGLSPVATAVKINKELKKKGLSLKGVDYRGDFNETIKFEGGSVNVRLKDRDKAKNLAIALYEIAKMNDPGNGKNCEIHISRYACSDNHPGGLLKAITDFEIKHGRELRAAKKK